MFCVKCATPKEDGLGVCPHCNGSKFVEKKPKVHIVLPETPFNPRATQVIDLKDQVE